MSIAETPATDLERRKQVKLLLRHDLGITPQRYEGRVYYVVKDPVSLRYYRFKEQEHFLIQLMDGKHTLDDAQKQFEKRFRPERLTLEDLEQFGQQLLSAGLVQNEAPTAGKQLFDRRKKRRRMEILQAFTNILYIKIPIFDPDKLLAKMLPYLKWIFTALFFTLSVGVMLAALMLVLTHFDTFWNKLPSYQEFFSFKTVVYLWAALGVVKVIHEFGHGLSCKAFGGEVHEMGFLILCFSPAMYCNVSDAWIMPSKWRRIIISFAGIYVELMIAAIATFVWWNSPSQPFINNLALSLMIVCSVSTVVFNGNPLMRFDGYYILADWLEIPNLRERANRYLGRLAMHYCLGIEVQPEPYMELWRRILFVSYAILSWFYRWMVTFVILSFMATFLKPYKLEIISQMLTAVALGSMIGWPLFRLIKNINKRGRLPDMKTKNVAITGTIVGVLLLAFFFLPLPVSRIREPGLVHIAWEHVDIIRVREEGILKKVNVLEGARVKKGQILATFENPDMEIRKNQMRVLVDVKGRDVERLKTQKRELEREGGPDKRQKEAQLQAELNKAIKEKKEAEDGLADIQADLEQLTIRSPRDGVVMGLPTQDDIGKKWAAKESADKPFCKVADPSKMRILVPLSAPNYELLLADLDKQGRHGSVPVTIRIQGHGDRVWKGRVSTQQRSMEAEKKIPVALATKGGGHLAGKDTGDPHYLVPQNPVYFVFVDFLELDSAISAGSRAQVKIHCEYRSAAWATWRWLSGTFDLGLAF